MTKPKQRPIHGHACHRFAQSVAGVREKASYGLERAIDEGWRYFWKRRGFSVPPDLHRPLPACRGPVDVAA